MKIAFSALVFVFWLGSASAQYYPFLGVHSPSASSLFDQWKSEVTAQGYTLPGTTHLGYIETLIDNLESSGLADKLDFFYIHAQDGSEGAGFVNAVDPGNYEITEVGSVSWTSGQGFEKPTTTSAYYDTGFVPSTAGGNFSQNSAVLGAAIEGLGTMNFNNTSTIMGTQGSFYDNYFSVRRSFGFAFSGAIVINNRTTTTAINSTQSNVRSNWTWSITGSTASESNLYFNGTDIGSSGFSTQGTPDRKIILGGYYDGTDSNPGNGSMDIYITYGGGGLTSSEVSDLDGYIDTYLTNLGL